MQSNRPRSEAVYDAGTVPCLPRGRRTGTKAWLVETLDRESMMGKLLDEIYAIVAVTLEHIGEGIIIIGLYALMAFGAWMVLAWMVGAVF